MDPAELEEFHNKYRHSNHYKKTLSKYSANGSTEYNPANLGDAELNAKYYLNCVDRYLPSAELLTEQETRFRTFMKAGREFVYADDAERKEKEKAYNSAASSLAYHAHTKLWKCWDVSERFQQYYNGTIASVSHIKIIDTYDRRTYLQHYYIYRFYVFCIIKGEEWKPIGLLNPLLYTKAKETYYVLRDRPNILEYIDYDQPAPALPDDLVGRINAQLNNKKPYKTWNCEEDKKKKREIAAIRLENCERISALKALNTSAQQYLEVATKYEPSDVFLENVQITYNDFLKAFDKYCAEADEESYKAMRVARATCQKAQKKMCKGWEYCIRINEYYRGTLADIGQSRARPWLESSTCIPSTEVAGTWCDAHLKFIYKFYVFDVNDEDDFSNWKPLGLLNPIAYIDHKIQMDEMYCETLLEFIDASQPAPELTAEIVDSVFGR